MTSTQEFNELSDMEDQEFAESYVDETHLESETLDVEDSAEIDSEDDIENLEEEPTNTSDRHINGGHGVLGGAREPIDVPSEDESLSESDHDRDAGNEAVGESDDEVKEVENQNGEGQYQDELKASENHLQHEVSQHNSPPQLRESDDETEHPHAYDEVPVFVDIADDRYLLVPFYKPSPHVTDDTISLFTVDEMEDLTLEKFFERLRDEDIFEAYPVLHRDNEFKVDFAELHLTVSEDNAHCTSVKITEVVQLLHQLRGEKLTVVVLMQPRFVSQLEKARQHALAKRPLAELGASQTRKRQKH